VQNDGLWARSIRLAKNMLTKNAMFFKKMALIMTDQKIWTHGAPAGYGIIFLRRGGEKQLVFRGGHPADTELFSG
jgi:hypothetical protein